MKRVKIIAYYFVIVLLILTIPFSILQILNAIISQKYETNSSTDCISGISGENLCRTKMVYEWLNILCGLLLVLLIIFRKRFINKNQS